MALLGAQFVNAVSPNPVGSLQAYAGASAPTGWLLCDNSEQAISTYPELYSVLGTTYGALTNGSGGAGSTHFRLPDLRGRVPVGKDNMGGSAASRLTSGGSGVDGSTLGASGGAQTHTLTVSQMPSHDHSINGIRSDISGLHFHPYNSVVAAGQENYAASGYTDSGPINNTGGGAAHNNVQPVVVTNYIIKAVPDAPRSGLAYGSTPPIVTALPANPQFGDVVTYIADATNGVAWNLQYDASGTYPWKFIGGSPLYAINATGGGVTTTSNSYQTTSIPSITLTLAGDYMITFGAHRAQNIAAGLNDAMLGLHVDGSATATAYTTNTTIYDGASVANTVSVTGIAANKAVDVRYKATQSINSQFANIYESITPIRVKAA